MCAAERRGVSRTPARGHAALDSSRARYTVITEKVGIPTHHAGVFMIVTHNMYRG